MEEGQGLPRRIVGADLLGRGRGGAVAEAAAAGFLMGGIRPKEKTGILAQTAEGGGVRRKVLEDGGIGVAAIESHQERARGGGGIGVEGGAQIADLFRGALAEAGGTGLDSIQFLFAGGRFPRRFRRRGGMAKSDGNHAAPALGKRESQRGLEETLGAHEIGLEARAEGIAAPGDAGGVQAGAAQQGVIQDRAHRGTGRELRNRGAAGDGEERLDGKAWAREEAVTGGPVVELRAAGAQQTGHGMTSQTEQGAQGEGLGVRGEAALVEVGGALAPEVFELGEDAGRVFFSSEGGGEGRRKASKPLFSTNHSTVSPRENSRAWARAEGKLMYHCSLVWRLMSWTLVGKPMEASFEISSHITRYQKSGSCVKKKT